MRILEELWYGNIEPTEYDTIACKEYKEVLRLITRDKLSRTFLSFFKKQPCNKMLQGCFFEINRDRFKFCVN